MDALVLFLISEGKAALLPWSMRLAVGWSHRAFIVLRCVPLNPFCDKFHQERLLNSQMLLHIGIIIFILHFVNGYYVDLQILNHPHIPGIDPTWSWRMIVLTHCWLQFANIFLSIFVSGFIRDIDLWWGGCNASGFGIRRMVALENALEQSSLFSHLE